MPWNHIEYFPDGMIALQAELSTGYHSSLMLKLSQFPSKETEMRIACIAAHCHVLLEGTYDQNDLDKVCAVLAGRLEILREPVPVEVIRTIQ